MDSSVDEYWDLKEDRGCREEEVYEQLKKESKPLYFEEILWQGR
jgi:hypothetical protein